MERRKQIRLRRNIDNLQFGWYIDREKQTLSCQVCTGLPETHPFMIQFNSGKVGDVALFCLGSRMMGKKVVCCANLSTGTPLGGLQRVANCTFSHSVLFGNEHIFDRETRFVRWLTIYEKQGVLLEIDHDLFRVDVLATLIQQMAELPICH